MAAIEFFVPSNRRRANGMPNHMDGTNEIVGSGLTNRNYAGRRKRENTEHVAKFAAAAMREQGWERPEGRVDVTLTWHEVNAIRDPDNIEGGAKYVMDALGTPSRWSEERRRFMRNTFGAGVIQDDSQRYVRSIHSFHDVDRENPGVTVRVETVDEEEK